MENIVERLTVSLSNTLFVSTWNYFASNVNESIKDDARMKIRRHLEQDLISGKITKIRDAAKDKNFDIS